MPDCGDSDAERQVQGLLDVGFAEWEAWSWVDNQEDIVSRDLISDAVAYRSFGLCVEVAVSYQQYGFAPAVANALRSAGWSSHEARELRDAIGDEFWMWVTSGIENAQVRLLIAAGFNGYELHQVLGTQPLEALLDSARYMTAHSAATSETIHLDRARS